jgi:hypothetical protein
MDTSMVWITDAGLYDGCFDEWTRKLSSSCESPAEEAMAAMLVDAAIATVERGRGGGYVAIYSQFDVSPTHGIPYRVDFLVVSKDRDMVAVEVDGFAWHSDQQAFSRDRKRDRAFALAYLPVMRFTAKEAFDGDESVGDDIFSLMNHE